MLIPDPSPALPPDVLAWSRGLASLSPATIPCPGSHMDEWHGTVRRCIAFVTTRGARSPRAAPRWSGGVDGPAERVAHHAPRPRLQDDGDVDEAAGQPPRRSDPRPRAGR